MNLRLIATTAFGVEAVCKREIEALGYSIVSTENGKITYLSDETGLVKSNLWLRTADRVFVEIGSFKAVTFDELFEQTHQLPWEEWIDETGAFPVNGTSVKSTLFSLSDCQAIIKKAIVTRLKSHYHQEWFDESGPLYPVRFTIYNDIVTLMIDTSGESLHKRGYRKEAITAPLKETLAASMVLLSYWRNDRTLVDYFCGSGTILIEAALIGRNIAPGLYRDFNACHWPRLKASLWDQERLRAKLAQKPSGSLSLKGFDIDSHVIEKAKKNADYAGVINDITFAVQDFLKPIFVEPYGIWISNPPYGDRLEKDTDLEPLYRVITKRIDSWSTWSIYLLTPKQEYMMKIKRPIGRKRKFYNGNIETNYYQFYGPNPHKLND